MSALLNRWRLIFKSFCGHCRHCTEGRCTRHGNKRVKPHDTCHDWQER